MINKIRIIAIGKVKERYLLEGINEFLKRLRPFCKIEIIELKDTGLEKEAINISARIDSKTYLLDPLGNQLSSEELADFLKKEDGYLTLVIGGPEGIANPLKDKCKKLSLSKMTFLHEMTRLLMLEQIYRAYAIIHNKKYHK
jgi:23S rRNA (pseudouridine1915-N3)-methyltransferase